MRDHHALWDEEKFGGELASHDDKLTGQGCKLTGQGGKLTGREAKDASLNSDASFNTSQGGLKILLFFLLSSALTPLACTHMYPLQEILYSCAWTKNRYFSRPPPLLHKLTLIAQNIVGLAEHSVS